MNDFFLFFSKIKIVKGKEFIAAVKPNQFLFFKMISNKIFWRMKFLHHQIYISTSLSAYILFRNRAKLPFFILLWHPRQIQAWMNFSLHTKWKVDPSNLPFIFTQKQTQPYYDLKYFFRKPGLTFLIYCQLTIFNVYYCKLLIT